MHEHPEQDLLPSFVHDRYRVERILREDDLGLTIHAFDTRLKRPVAIRCLRANPGTAPQEEYRARKDRITQEIEAAARIGFHTHIVPLLDFITTDDDTYYLVVEYLPGGSLEEQLTHGPVPLGDALQITIDAADALAVAHAAGVVHRDIRPGTLFLTGAGRAKVGGFGLAQIEAQESRTRAIMLRLGTPQYMSPEQEAYLHPATDQYSLGLVLFEMLTGAQYKQLGAAEVAQRLGEQPSPVAALIRRMTARYPEERFASLEEVAQACTAAMQQVALPTDEPPGMLDVQVDGPPDSAASVNNGAIVPHQQEESPLVSAWAKAYDPPQRDSPTAVTLEPESPLQPAASHAAPRGRLIAEIGVLVALLFMIVGAFVAHFWARLF